MNRHVAWPKLAIPLRKNEDLIDKKLQEAYEEIENLTEECKSSLSCWLWTNKDQKEKYKRGALQKYENALGNYLDDQRQKEFRHWFLKITQSLD